VDHVELGGVDEQQARQVAAAADARRRVVELAGLRTRHLEQLPERLHRQCGGHRHHQRAGGPPRDRREVPGLELAVLDRATAKVIVATQIGLVIGTVAKVAITVVMVGPRVGVLPIA
jgi:hypothetical protein